MVPLVARGATVAGWRG